MKLLKISILRQSTFKNKKYNLFKIKTNRDFNPLVIGTKIRRNLIKETKGTKITQASLFVLNKKSKEKLYHSLNEFTNIEEISEKTNEIIKNLERLKIKLVNKNLKKKIICITLTKENSFFKEIYKTIKISNLNQKICTIKSHNVEIKLLLKIEKEKGIKFNPIETINFIIPKKNNENNSSLFLETIRNDQTFTELYQSLKLIYNQQI
uniref:DNA-directed RNA polymerase subunit alpha n=1 Tax=Euglena anabaena TaxID=38273 RepID=RPOA_EUGAN|nr:RecName: Full=DNA-directed RNA polymerase subunit alpha; Short=PEP; AltName: Full=Plastid-encoded RNA polymerase subunit alpha; Short=RNA polymerase subunit alpha [Euglenaria anabaena]AAL83360.1 RNA polymerase alpha subunit [Euglenaria anabaena]